MFEVYEMNPHSGRYVHARYDTFEAAEAHILARSPVCYERDEDHADCADAFLASGIVLSIEPRP